VIAVAVAVAFVRQPTEASFGGLGCPAAVCVLGLDAFNPLDYVVARLCGGSSLYGTFRGVAYQLPGHASPYVR
jgi:hypothetical protein